MGDEWRSHAFGFAGDPNAHTPVFDRFASESLNFEQFVAGCSVCCPARASMITGQYPLTHGVYINDFELKPTGTTLAEAFRNADLSHGLHRQVALVRQPRRALRAAAGPTFLPTIDSGSSTGKAAECTHDYNKSFYYEATTRRGSSGRDTTPSHKRRTRAGSLRTTRGRPTRIAWCCRGGRHTLCTSSSRSLRRRCTPQSPVARSG